MIIVRTSFDFSIRYLVLEPERKPTLETCLRLSAFAGQSVDELLAIANQRSVQPIDPYHPDRLKIVSIFYALPVAGRRVLLEVAELGSLMSQTLNLRIPITWDVYLLYLPEHPWDAELPPAPEFWMHQQDEEASLYLDPSRFKQYVQTVVERTAFND